jgi:hypothetical protein
MSRTTTIKAESQDLRRDGLQASEDVSEPFTRLVAVLSEQNDAWLVQRRYLSVESMALILAGTSGPENSLEQQPDREETVALTAA